MIRAKLTIATVLTLLVGCQSSGLHSKAKEEANERWNLARANVKARLAAEQLETGSTNKAASEIAAARELDPDNPAHGVLEARVLLAAGEVDAAGLLLQNLVVPEGAGGEVAYLRGVVEQQRLNWPAALDHFLEALDRSPRDLAYMTAAIQVLLQIDKAETAYALLQTHKEHLGWTAAYQACLAETCEQLELWHQAAEAWRRVVADDADPGIQERLAISLERAGDFHEAVMVLEALEPQVEDSTRINLALARCYMCTENLMGARQTLYKLLSDQPSHVTALRMLADVLVRQQSLEDALPVALEALALDGKHVPTIELAAAIAHFLEESTLAAALRQHLAQLAPESPILLALVRLNQDTDTADIASETPEVAVAETTTEAPLDFEPPVDVVATVGFDEQIEGPQPPAIAELEIAPPNGPVQAVAPAASIELVPVNEPTPQRVEVTEQPLHNDPLIIIEPVEDPEPASN